MLQLQAEADTDYFKKSAEFKNGAVSSFPGPCAELCAFVEKFPNLTFISGAFAIYQPFFDLKAVVEKDKSTDFPSHSGLTFFFLGQWVEGWSVQFAMLVSLFLKGLSRIINKENWVSHSEEKIGEAVKLRTQIFDLAYATSLFVTVFIFFLVLATFVSVLSRISLHYEDFVHSYQPNIVNPSIVYVLLIYVTSSLLTPLDLYCSSSCYFG